MASPSSLRCFRISELNPPMVSAYSPLIEPLRSRMNTTSVKPFLMIAYPLAFCIFIVPKARGHAVACHATNSAAEQRLAKGEERLVDDEDIVLLMHDEVLHDDV